METKLEATIWGLGFKGRDREVEKKMETTTFLIVIQLLVQGSTLPLPMKEANSG